MAWALLGDGTGYLTFASDVYIAPSDDFCLTFKVVWKSLSWQALLGLPTDSNNYIRFYGRNNGVRVKTAGGNNDFTFINNLVDDTEYTFKFKRFSGVMDVTDENDVSLVSVTRNDSRELYIKGLFGFVNSSQFWKSEFLSLELEVNNVVLNKWDSSASDHSGSTDQPILTDTVGGNNATGVNFPSFDPSVWIDLGGGGSITVNDTTVTTKTSSNSDSILNVGAFNVLDNTTSTKTKSNSDFIQLAAAVSINDSLTTSKSNSNADTVLNVGAFNILDSTNTTKAKSNQDSIQFAASVFVIDSVTPSKSKSNVDSVLLVGQFFISDSTATSKLNAGSDLVYLSSTVSISDSITTTKSSTNNDLVLFVGEFNVTDTVVTTKSNSNNDNVSLVGEFVVLDSTATTKTDSNRDGVIIGEIVVSFNPETNYTQLFLSTTYTQPDLSRNYSQVFLSTNYSQ